MEISVTDPLIPSIADQPDVFASNNLTAVSIAFVTSGASIASCSVSPDLPEGLALSSSATECLISGTPTYFWPELKTKYTITAKSLDHSTSSASINITILEQLLPNLQDEYNGLELVATVDPVIANFLNWGSPVDSCSVSPDLPDGLSVGVSGETCSITGYCNEIIATTTFTVTGHSSDTSSSSGTIDISSIAAQPPVFADIADLILTQNVAMTPVTLVNSGRPATYCGTQPELPVGLSVAVDGDTCTISGTPTALSATASYYIAAITSYDGSSSSISVNIEVN